jgi:hypothetical protein
MSAKSVAQLRPEAPKFDGSLRDEIRLSAFSFLRRKTEKNLEIQVH